MSGQTLTDRIAAAQYQLTGSDMARAVCKATTHEVMAPKKKHLEYLVSATNTTNVNIPQMADTLFERSTNASWVVVFKALVTTHHICVHGNERFIQYLASRTSLFNLSNFIDKTGSHGETILQALLMHLFIVWMRKLKEYTQRGASGKSKTPHKFHHVKNTHSPICSHINAKSCL
uniref:ENTH domain-containing protein n=1 Tax=Kryptolebias marmoratus TaxID=37003 RepID=A0A3Q3B634_KRYMA